jgi:hypothetical protein
MRRDQAVDVVWVGKPDGGPAEVQGFGGDSDLAAALTRVGTSDILIEDALAGAWYAVDGQPVRPLNRWARGAVAEPEDLSAVQKVVAAPPSSCCHSPPWESPWRLGP